MTTPAAAAKTSMYQGVSCPHADDRRQSEGLGQEGGLGEHDEPPLGDAVGQGAAPGAEQQRRRTCAATTRPAQSALSVRSQASQVRAVVCTQLPVSDTNCP